MWAQVSFVLSQSTCLTDGQTDGWPKRRVTKCAITDKQMQTDG